MAQVAAPVLAAKLEDVEYDPNPQYTYAYDVQDTITGDSKSQYETREGDIVRGRYSLIEPDGTLRVVEYTADPINGFNAVVNREAPVVAAVPAKVVAPAVVAAPAKVVAAAKVVRPVVAAPARVAVPARIARPVVAAPVVAPAPAKVVAAAPAKVVAPVAQVEAVPTFARLSYPFASAAAPIANPVRFAKLISPFNAPFVYSAPLTAKVVTPFGYSAAYSTIV